MELCVVFLYCRSSGMVVFADAKYLLMLFSFQVAKAERRRSIPSAAKVKQVRVAELTHFTSCLRQAHTRICECLVLFVECIFAF